MNQFTFANEAQPKMNEQLLSFVWSNYLFDLRNLCTTDHQEIQILNAGLLNSDAGADFMNACIMINGVKWFGWVEIHQKSSDWFKHQHHTNRNYDAVILHLVYEHDLAENHIFRNDQSVIPILELKNRINPLVLEQYARLDQTQSIPCFSQFDKLEDADIQKMQEYVLQTRLLRKAEDVRFLWGNNRGDWEETLYHKLATHFGFKKNNDCFLRLVKSIPLKIVLKHLDNSFQLESLFFGQAGFLDLPSDEYAQKLNQEYHFLAHKYQLLDTKLKRSDWKFLRMRPSNFPTLRLAQFVTLLYSKHPTFTQLISNPTIPFIRQIFSFELSEYWQHHYDFGKPSKKKLSFGKTSIDNLIINVICPIYMFYAQEKGQQNWQMKCLEILKDLPAEHNKITRLWKSLKITNKNAAQSQAIIELYHHWCERKKCLDCELGKYLLIKKR